MLEKTRHRINSSLKLFLLKAKKDYRFDLVHPRLFKSLEEFILRDGKRLRPTLLVYSYKGYASARRRITPSIYYVSTCIELLHAFMLVHDDIIDCSPLRRGKPTMHRLLSTAVPAQDPERLGTDLGIVAGDIIYALAIDAFLSVNEDPRRKEAALKYFIQTAVFTAMGEFIDTVHGLSDINKVREPDVMLNYTLKTARYTFDCPMVVGAILAGAAAQDIRGLSRLGRLMGQAFQIQDDIIGIFATQKSIGKSVLSDLEERKKTLLICHAFRHLRGKKKKKFLTLFNKKYKDRSDLAAMRKILVESQSLHYSLGEIKKRLRDSEKILAALRMKPLFRRQMETTLFTLYQPARQISSRYHVDFPIRG